MSRLSDRLYTECSTGLPKDEQTRSRSLAFKLAGIYVLVQCALSLFAADPLLYRVQAQLAPASLASPTWAFWVISGAPTVALAILGATLIGFSARFAAWTFSDPDGLATAEVTSRDLQRSVFTVVGASMIATALPDFASMGYYLATLPQYVEGVPATLLQRFGSEVAQRSAQILIGASLVLGRHGAVEAWRKVRAAWWFLRGRVETDFGP